MEILDIKKEFVELRAKGWSFDKIAKKLGKAKQTLIDWSKELELEIANLKALELEELYEKHFLQKQTRLSAYGDILSKLKKEIASRELKELKTEKLLELYLKYNDIVKEEYVEPIFRSSQDITEEKLDKELIEELTSPKKLKVA